MGFSFSNITSSPAAIALLTVSTAFVISIALNTSEDSSKMTSKEKAIEAAGEAKLPEGVTPGSFMNKRGQSLYTVQVKRKDESVPAKAMVVVAHGIAEHCCRAGYLRVYESLAMNGIDVYALDHHGHGRSDGEPRGYADKFDHYVDDFVEYIELCKKNYSGSPPPLLVMGHSMGALLVVITVLKLGKEGVAGMILTGPALGVDMSLEMKVQKVFAPVINTLAPKAAIVDAVQPEDLSRNKDAVQAYIDDPLCTKGKIIARTAIDMSKTFDVAQSRREEISCPILILHGTGDKTTSHRASAEFFGKVSTPLEKKRYLKLPGLYHELFEEPETEQFIEAIVGFTVSGGKAFKEVEGEEKEGVIHVALKS